MSYTDRCSEIIRFFATRGKEGYIDRTGLFEIAARLVLGNYDERSEHELDVILDSPHGDMFWMIPVTLITLVGETGLSEDSQNRLRNSWKEYTPYRGDTENHWLMYYASMYLIASKYDDEPASFWFNGLSSKENCDEAREYLFHWFDHFSTEGQAEFHSPHYIAFFVTPLALLRGFAAESSMQHRADAALLQVLHGLAASSINGMYVGAFSRIYPEPLLERWKNPSTTLAWLLFDNTPFRPHGVNVVLPRIGYRPHASALVLAISGYLPSAELIQLACDRSTPYVYRERHHTRPRIRYANERSAPVYRTTFVTDDFALGSIQGGLLQPIQQHSWELFWDTDDPHQGHNVLFTVHPYASEVELGMYFPEEPELLESVVIGGEKPTYASPDKWTGGSPFEQIVQHENSLIVLYDIPPKTRFPHISGFFSRHLRHLEEHETGWIFAEAGRCLVAYYPLADYEWRDEIGGDRRLHSEANRNGAIVHVARKSDCGSLASFRQMILGCRVSVDVDSGVSATFESPSGDVIEARYGEVPKLNDVSVDYGSWPLRERTPIRR